MRIMLPRKDQVAWLRNGKPRERLAIYLDTMYMLWDDGSIRSVTLSSLSKEEFNLLKETVGRQPARVSIVDSPKTSEILRPLIVAEARKMQDTIRDLTSDYVLEMNMQVCHLNRASFQYLLKKLTRRQTSDD